MLSKRRKYRKMSDEDLILHYKDRTDNSILGELYSRYAHLVLGVALKYTKNKIDAEDICMIVFEKLPPRIIKTEIKNFKSWLYVVTKNEVFMSLRKKKIRLNNEEIEIEDENNSNEIYAKEEKLNLLEQLVQTLKEDQRKCIELFYIEQKSYIEIASILSLDIKKIKSAIQNGKRNLKIKLEQNEEFKSI